MPVVASDLVAFLSANMPVADSGTAGGAIDLLRRPDFTQIAADDDIEVISSSASDTQNCTITGRNAAGSIVTETKTLTGTSAAIFATLGVINRVLIVDLASTAVGTVTVRRSVAGATVRTIAAGERGFKAIFQQLASDPSVQKDYYSKIFVKNTNGTLALVNALVTQSSDPSGFVTHLLAASKDDTATATNRITAPAAADTQDPDTFDDTDKSVPGADLGAGVAVGVWLRYRLPAGTAAQRSTYTLGVSGQSA